MVIGLLIVTAIPTVTAVCQAVSAQKNRDQLAKDERRMKKFNIDVQYEGANHKGHTIHDTRVVVKNDRVWIGPRKVDKQGAYGYVSECMIVEYPDPKRDPVALGLVSQVQNNPPLLNWIYVDSETLELKYGNKSASIEHHIGSWDWTEDEQYLTMEEIRGGQGQDFIAVENPSAGQWQLFYDLEGDELEGIVPDSWIKVPVRLRRTLLPEK